MEYMLGGDFGSILEKVGCLDEQVAKFYFAELVLAVESLHNLGIVHRDLKPDNLLLDAKGHIKLTDFGLSEIGLERLRNSAAPSKRVDQKFDQKLAEKTMLTFNKLISGSDENKIASKVELQIKKHRSKAKERIFGFLDKEQSDVMKFANHEQKTSEENNPSQKPNVKDSEKRHRIVGTPDYMAPEIVTGEDCSSKAIDWWSMGVILYEFLVGIPPFNDDTVEKIFENIVKLRIQWPQIGYDEDCLSPEAADLIKKLLTLDPKKRLGSKNGAEEIKEHVFFAGFDWECVRENEAPIIPVVQDSTDLSNFEKSGRSVDEEPFNRTMDAPLAPRSKTQPIDLAAFRMRRLDILDKLNQEEFQKHKR